MLKPYKIKMSLKLDNWQAINKLIIIITFIENAKIIHKLELTNFNRYVRVITNVPCAAVYQISIYHDSGKLITIFYKHVKEHITFKPRYPYLAKLNEKSLIRNSFLAILFILVFLQVGYVLGYVKYLIIVWLPFIIPITLTTLYYLVFKLSSMTSRRINKLLIRK